jgi:hypothetical protein
MKKSLMVLLVVGAAAGAVWRWRGHAASAVPADGQKLVYDRLWIDHMPKNDKDTFNVFAAITEEPLGIFQQTSQWRGNFEMFQYEGRGGELRIVYPQTGDKEKVTARAKECSDQRHMDFCLELGGASRGVKQYYSREGWEIGAAHDVDAIRARVAQLVHAE